MSNENFDQDNVFAETNSAFDDRPATAAKAGKGSKATVKKGGGSIPISLWIVIGVMILLVGFVLMRLLGGGGGEANSGDDLAPISQATPQIVEDQPQEAVHAAAPAAVLDPLQQGVPQAHELLIPGDEVLQPPVAAPTPAVAEVAVADTASAPVALPAASVASVNTPAVTVAASQSVPLNNDERKAYESKIEALSGDVERLRRQIGDGKTARASAAPRRRAAPSTASSAVASSPKPVTQTAPEPIVGVRLKAIVEDSAWLQSASGETVMVQPGDKVEGVGMVKAIDPDAGTVRFTDGRVLR